MTETSKITFNSADSEAKVYHTFQNKRNETVYLVKVSFMTVGMHISSITVQPSFRDSSKIWIQLPRYNVRGTWIWPLVFEKNAAIGRKIKELAHQAAFDHSQQYGTPLPSGNLNDTIVPSNDKEFL